MLTQRPTSASTSGTSQATVTPTGSARVLPGNDALARLATLAVAVAVAMLPLLRPGGPGNSAPVDIVIVVAIVATVLAVIASRATVRLPYVVPVGLTITAGAFAAMLHEPTSGAVLALGQDLLVFLFAAAIVNACRRPEDIGAVLRTWSIAATVWAALMVIAVAVGDSGLAGDHGPHRQPSCPHVRRRQSGGQLLRHLGVGGRGSTDPATVVPALGRVRAASAPRSCSRARWAGY